jgi:hypothetical protein
MIFWKDDKAIIYVSNYIYQIEDSIKIQPFFFLNSSNIKHEEISLLIFNKNSILSFYLVCDSEEALEIKERNGKTYQNKVFRFHLQKYYTSEDLAFNDEFIKHLNCESKSNSFIKFSENNNLRKYQLDPFGTVFPIGKLKCYKYIYQKHNANSADAISLATWIEKTHNIAILTEINTTVLYSLASLDFLNNSTIHLISEEIDNQISKVLYSKMLIKSLDKELVEIKTSNQVAFSSESITDDDEKYVVKKGVSFFFEQLSQTNNVVFSYSNFLRSSKPINELEIKEPINHKEHQFVNIKTGHKLSKKASELKNIKQPLDYFETFTNTDIYDLVENKIRFSQKAYHFQQTNLSDTVALISRFKESLIGDNNFGLDKINDLLWNYRFVKKTRKLIFRSGELHYTSSKGLHHSGVLQVPENLKLQVLISKNAFEMNNSEKLLEKVNAAIYFLYKEVINPISSDDLLIYDYNIFEHLSFSPKISEEKSVLAYLIDPNKTSHKLNQIQKDKTVSVNNQIIEILKHKAGNFSIIGEIDSFIFANAILKIGLKKGAIPWKIDAIDKNDPNHIFIGIDLGHNHESRKSNLTITAVNNQGCFIDCVKAKDLEINEEITTEVVYKSFKRLFRKIQQKKLLIENITIHRDGRFFENINEFNKAIKTSAENFTLKSINLVEVIKNEVPIIGFKNETQYIDSFEGLYFFISDTSYLITNDQSLQTKTAPKPLKIRKISGNKTIAEITEEVYWLTKPYSVNLFTPSKLPLTTLLSNNLSYSKDLVHFITA